MTRCPSGMYGSEPGLLILSAMRDPFASVKLDWVGAVTQLALDIPAGRPFRVENRGWLPADAACLWSLEAVS